MGIQNVVNHVSGYKPFENKPLAVKVCTKVRAAQSCPWNPFILSITAGTVAGMRPMVPSF